MNQAFNLMALTLLLLSGSTRADDEAHGEAAKGPHGGRLLQKGDFSLELTVFETGVEPQFRAYAYLNDAALDPATVSLSLALTRLGGTVDQFAFTPQAEYLLGDGVVREPHSFVVAAAARHRGASYHWTYDSFEGRTSITQASAAAAGIQIEVAGPATVRETLVLHGIVVPDPARVFQLRARYPGVVKEVRKRLGESVAAGDVLLVIEANDSLQRYNVVAPSPGVVVHRDVNPGMVANDQTLVTIADLTTVWVELAAFQHDLDQIRAGQSVTISDVDGHQTATGVVDSLAPVGAPASQSMTVRVVVDNTDGRWRPGLFVTGELVVAQTTVPIAVRRSALQSFRDWTVVFEQVGDEYEARPVTLGRGDDDWVEVLGRTRSRCALRDARQLSSSRPTSKSPARRMTTEGDRRAMIDRILHLAIERRWLVLLAAFAVAALGAWNYQRLPIDAVPDITNVQVQINTEAPGYTPLESEQRITFIVETAMSGLPKLDYTRSLSRYGLSQVTVVFEDGTDIYFARQLVAERLQAVKAELPAGLEPQMGPIATGLGEIFMYTVDSASWRDERRRHASDADRSAHRAGLGDPTAAAARARRYRGEHHRRLRQTIPRDAEPREAAGVRPRLRRCAGCTRAEQRQRRRRIRRTQRRPVSGARAGPGHEPGRNPADRRRAAQQRADPPDGRRECRSGQGVANRRGDAERRGSRTRHRVHADGREQSHGVASVLPRSSRRSTSRCRPASAQIRFTTAPFWSIAPSQPSRRTSSSAPCW